MKLNALEIIKNDAKQYNFYQLVNLLLALEEIDPESEEWELAYKLFFSGRDKLAFAETDISRVEFEEFTKNIETTFLGLTGSQSPLPNFFLDEIARNDDENIRSNFLDFFNHRVISMLYRLWRKYRYYEIYKANASDKISEYFFSFIGLKSPSLRNKSDINWCKMLAYIGMLSGQNRSAQVISGILSHYFDLKASVTEWVIRYVMIPDNQLTSVGKANSQLGNNMLLGERIKDRSSKFVVNLHNLKMERFMQFLPHREEHRELKEVVAFILKTQMAYDLNLISAPNETPPLNLSSDNGSLLGWTSFLEGGDPSKSVLLQVHL